MRLAGIEPARPPWEGEIIPLDQSRFLYVFQYNNYFKGYYSGNFMAKKESGIERQLLWYMYSTDILERHFWNVLIVNEQREIDLARQKLYEQLNPIVEGTNLSLKPIVNDTPIDKGKIRGSKLVYNLFCLETVVSSIDFSKMYQGKVKKDRRLYPRKTKEGWFDFIDKIYSGEI